MAKKRSDPRSNAISSGAEAEAPALSEPAGSLRVPLVLDDSPAEGSTPLGPPEQSPHHHTALYHLLEEIHNLIEFGESHIAELAANTHFYGIDRFVRLEGWLLDLTKKSFPGLITPQPDVVGDPLIPSEFRTGPWLPASLNRVDPTAVEVALRALAKQTRAWQDLFPFRSVNEQPMGWGPRLIELPDDHFDEAKRKRYDEDYGRWTDALKRTNKAIVEAIEALIEPFRRLRTAIVDQSLEANEEAQRRAACNKPGYLDLILDRQRHCVGRTGWGENKVELASRKLLWGLFVLLFNSGDAHCSREAIERIWPESGRARKTAPGTIDDTISDLRGLLEKMLGITIKVARGTGWRLEESKSKFMNEL